MDHRDPLRALGYAEIVFINPSKRVQVVAERRSTEPQNTGRDAFIRILSNRVFSIAKLSKGFYTKK